MLVEPAVILAVEGAQVAMALLQPPHPRLTPL